MSYFKIHITNSVYIKLIYICTIIIFSQVLHAQQSALTFQHLTIDQGLSSNVVYCAVQDNQGFMWLGTNDGLNKYDGNTCKVLHPIENDSFSMGFNSVSTAFKDSKGRLWFGSNGIMKCDPLTEKFITYQHHKNDKKSLGNDDVSAIAEDENGNIWIGTRIGLYMFDEAQNSFIPYFHDTSGTIAESYGHNRVIDILKDKEGIMWISTLQGLFRFSTRTKIFEGYYHDDQDPSSLAQNHVVQSVLDDENSLWVITNSGGLQKFNKDTKKFQYILLPDAYQKYLFNEVKHIYADKKGKLYITTSYNGILILDIKKNIWNHYEHDIFDSKSLLDDQTTCIYEDHSGMIWIGIYYKGISRFGSIPNKFKTYTQMPGKPLSLPNNEINCFAEERNGNIWIGSKNGLFYFNKKENTFINYQHSDNNKNSVSHNMIHAIALDSEQNLWVATPVGLSKYNKNSSVWKHYTQNIKDSNSLPANIIYGVTIASNGSIWAAGNGGVLKLEEKNNHFSNQYTNKNIKKLPRIYYNLIFEDSKHEYWLSTFRGGILRVTEEFKIMNHYANTKDFPEYRVNGFAEDIRGNIWICGSSGLYLWNRNSQQIINFNKHDLLKTEIRSIAIESQNKIWIGTANGLIQIQLDNNYQVINFKKYLLADGLQSNVFNHYAAARLRTGELIFGGSNGFNIFRPKEIKFNTYIPKVYLNSFKVFDKDYPIYKKNDSSSYIDLDYKHNFFSFDMASFNFDHPEKNEYGYQLIGFDEKMNYNGTRHFASYTNVPPGKYTLHIIGSNNDAVWKKMAPISSSQSILHTGKHYGFK